MDAHLKWAEIDLGVMAANVRAIRAALGPDARFMAVVKLDGYGHGAFETARTALAGGADLAGVLTAEEGARLREAGIKCPVVLLAPSLPSEAGEIIRHGLTPTADSPAFLAALSRAYGPSRDRYPFIADVDLGLGRWGVRPADFPAFLKEAARYPNIRPSSVSAHLAYTAQKNMTEGEEKLGSFKKLCEKHAPGLPMHAANSAVFCDFPRWRLDMVRIGNLLYGIYPSGVYLKRVGGPPVKGLGRPWKFFARVVSVKSVRRGESLGYASEYVAPRDMKLATVACGYGDGLTMEPSERSIKLSAGTRNWAVIRGRQAPFVGKTGIAHTLLDVTGIPGVRPGEPAMLPIRRTAANARIPRIYRGR